jgi:inhibitor of cysteine peptidase
MAELRLGVADKGRTVAAQVGDTIVVTLPENATTGYQCYQWNVDSCSEGTMALEETDATSAPVGAMGAGGGEVTVRLKATAAGAGNVILKLSRGTESSAFEFRVDFDIS